MLKTQSAEEREASYKNKNPRECLPFTREAAKSVMSKPVKMK